MRWCNVHAVVLGDGSYPLLARSDQPALPFSPKHRWRGRASDPFFLTAVVWADPASRRPPSDIPVDHIRLGKVWMLSVDAVAVADGENPLSARPDQGSRRSFSLSR